MNRVRFPVSLIERGEPSLTKKTATKGAAAWGTETVQRIDDQKNISQCVNQSKESLFVRTTSVVFFAGVLLIYILCLCLMFWFVPIHSYSLSNCKENNNQNVMIKVYYRSLTCYEKRVERLWMWWLRRSTRITSHPLWNRENESFDENRALFLWGINWWVCVCNNIFLLICMCYRELIACLS